MTSVLVAGIGNIFFGDDGFGVEVVRCLRERFDGVWPPDVRVLDCGICGIDLYYALLDGVELAILVDTVHRDGPPGRLYVIEPSVDDTEGLAGFISPHELQPANVLRALHAAGAALGRVVLVGCEPDSFGTEDGGPGRIGLSGPVAQAVTEAVEQIEAMLAQTSAARARDAKPAPPEYRRVL